MSKKIQRIFKKYALENTLPKTYYKDTILNVHFQKVTSHSLETLYGGLETLTE